MPSKQELLASIQWLKEQIQDDLKISNPTEFQKKQLRMRVKILREKEQEYRKKEKE
ncbi:MAG: hypothetical protein AB8G86_23645 [Saprospiraceae bacterium]